MVIESILGTMVPLINLYVSSKIVRIISDNYLDINVSHIYYSTKNNGNHLYMRMMI